MAHIPHNDLTPDQIPPPKAGWREIGWFALTFDGYEVHGGFEACGDIANQCRQAYETRQSLPETLTELRTCLFFEQRRWRHYGYSPDENAMIYIHALVEQIREKIGTKDF